MNGRAAGAGLPAGQYAGLFGVLLFIAGRYAIITGGKKKS